MPIFNIFLKYFSRILPDGGTSYSIPPLTPFCVCETGPEEDKPIKHVSIMNWVGVGGADRKVNLENLPNTFCKNPRNTKEYAGDFLCVFPLSIDSGGTHVKF
jgi:hypothetical protein